MQDELQAFFRIRDLLAPLPSFDWPLFWPQLSFGLLLIGFGLWRNNYRLWAVTVGVSLLLITFARFAGILYLGSRLVLLLWLMLSMISLVWLGQRPGPPAAEKGAREPPFIILPKKRRR